METAALPATCPACAVAAEQGGGCPRCGLSARDRVGLLQAGCDAYAEAHALALSGRFAEARGRLRDARALGLDDHLAAQRLDALCAAALGVWESAPRALLPVAWREPVRRGSTTRKLYAAARRSAARSDWAAARAAAAQCLQQAPWLLPARKLHLLALAGLGREHTAERLRESALGVFPAESDLVRWRFAAGSRRRPRVLPQRTAPRPEPPATALPKAAIGLAGLAILLAIAALAVALRPQPAPKAVVFASPAPRSAATPMPASRRDPLWREADEARQEATERAVRRWFNDALAARRTGDLRRTERLAKAVSEIGKETYLYEDSLLLLAQIADNQRDPRAAALYRRLLQERPFSAYTPAARRAVTRLEAAAAPESGR